MFGYLRFLLALLVVVSHLGMRFEGLNPGVMAVVIFYLLAGYVVSHLYYDILPDGRDKIFRLYADRMRRIFPLYLYVLFLTVLFISITSFGAPDFSFIKMIANGTIIPLNYYMFADFTILTNPSWCLIPPAWSLGAELQAYLLLPLVFLCFRLKWVLGLLTFAVYLAANFSIIHPDYFGYRLIAGVFFIFIIGSSIQRSYATLFDKYFPLLVWGTVLLLFVMFYSMNLFSSAYTKETFIGLLIGIPLIYGVSRSQIKLPFNAELGGLSYGIFLSHFLSMWILKYVAAAHPQSYTYAVMVIGLSCLISYVGVKLIEKHTNKWRK